MAAWRTATNHAIAGARKEAARLAKRVIAADRELAATATSRVNGCVYCASVHARLFANLSKKRDLAQRLLDDGVDANFPEREQAIVDASVKLTTDPEAIAATDLAPLRDQGLDDLGILDVIQSAAIFANANRLMLTLGEPRRQSSDQ